MSTITNINNWWVREKLIMGIHTAHTEYFFTILTLF